MALIDLFDFRHRVAPCLRIFLPLCFLLFAACNEEEADLVFESEIGRWQYLTVKNGLGSNHVNTVFEDSKGNTWIGTTGGVTVVSNNSIRTYTRVDGLLDNSVFAISEDREGAIWLGTRRGLNIFLNEQWLYFNYFYNAPVFALLALQDDEGMLIGTGGYGIYRYSYSTPGFSIFNGIEDCDACNSINSMFQSSDESVWIASFGGARRIRGNFITQFDTTDGLAGNIATTIAEDSWGNIWIGTVEGKTISKIKGNTISQVSFNNGAEQNFIFGIQEDNTGDLWVGTVANGLFHYDGAIMKQVYEGPPDNTITALFKDSRGNLWVGTSEGGLAIYISNPPR